jgi:hypothetical protein
VDWKEDDKVYQLTIQKKSLDVAKFYTMVQCCSTPKNHRGHFNLGLKKQKSSHMEDFKT